MKYINARFSTQAVTGVQRYAIEISKHLIKFDSNIKFISPRTFKKKELAEELDICTFGMLKGHLWEQIELPVYLKNHGYPLLLNFGNTAPLFYKKQIVVIHDLSFLRNPGWFSKKYYYYHKFMINRIAQNSLKIITVSEFSKNEIVDLLNISEDKVSVVYNAVSEKLINEERKKIIQNCDNYILTVSSLDPRKNLLNLITAVKKIKFKDSKLIIVGSKNKIFANKQMDTLMNSDPDIVFTGRISDMELVGLYKNARLFIYPSFYEGFGLPPLEAMACGCPVIVSETASLPEVCGDAAYYINPFSIESITDGINKVLTDENLRQGLIQRGLIRSKLFNWEMAAKEHLQIFQEFSDN